MSNCNSLLHILSKKLNITPLQLQKILQKGDIKALSSLLSAEQSAEIQKTLSDPKSIQDILNSKEAEAFKQQLQQK